MGLCNKIAALRRRRRRRQWRKGSSISSSSWGQDLYVLLGSRERVNELLILQIVIELLELWPGTNELENACHNCCVLSRSRTRC